jgi:hypothetical protein
VNIDALTKRLASLHQDAEVLGCAHALRVARSGPPAQFDDTLWRHAPQGPRPQTIRLDLDALSVGELEETAGEVARAHMRAVEALLNGTHLHSPLARKIAYDMAVNHLRALALGELGALAQAGQVARQALAGEP